MYKKPVIVFEGIEGSGKSYHSKKVSNYLKKKKQEILVVMGDGALNEGMNFEALNHLKDCKGKIIIIFKND